MGIQPQQLLCRYDIKNHRAVKRIILSFTTIVISLGIGFYLITCWAIIDIARKDFGGIEKKALWGIITLIPFIGPILYIVMGHKKGSRPSNIVEQWSVLSIVSGVQKVRRKRIPLCSTSRGAVIDLFGSQSRSWRKRKNNNWQNIPVLIIKHIFWVPSSSG